jgi:hypothetical protein
MRRPAATRRGQPPLAPQHDDGDQELIARLRAKSGEVWGALSLYREPGRPSFDEADKHFLRAVAPHLITDDVAELRRELDNAAVVRAAS